MDAHLLVDAEAGFRRWQRAAVERRRGAVLGDEERRVRMQLRAAFWQLIDMVAVVCENRRGVEVFEAW